MNKEPRAPHSVFKRIASMTADPGGQTDLQGEVEEKKSGKRGEGGGDWKKDCRKEREKNGVT